jgi:hypothetical protein
MENKIQIKVDNEIIKGRYANSLEVKSNREEFCLDFFNVFPPVGAMTARIMMSPGHMKRVVNLLQRTMEDYEKKHGKIEEAQEKSKSDFGFKVE